MFGCGAASTQGVVGKYLFPMISGSNTAPNTEAKRHVNKGHVYGGNTKKEKFHSRSCWSIIDRKS